MTNIFNHRIDSAALRLENLDTILRRMDQRATHVRSLRDELTRERGQINDTLAKLTERLERILVLSDDPTPEIAEIKNATEIAKNHLTRLVALIQAAREKANDIAVVQLNPEALTRRTSEFKERIAQGKDQLAEIRAEIRSKGCGNGPWTNFRDLSAIWMEYLDYLSGLCIRHECVDDRVCEIADALINELEQKTDNLSALAIPGREGRAGTLPRAVYLRFPEWTVWALPLATRELWHIAREVSRVGQNFPTYAKRHQLPDAHLKGPSSVLLHECFADMFATYIMGPSYACAAVLLALDPLKPTHQERAAAILQTLLWLGSPSDKIDDSEVNPYSEVCRGLERSWDEAVREARTDHEELTDILQMWMQAFLGYLATIGRLRFPTPSWVAVKYDWMRELRSGNVDEVAVEGQSVRLALSAAWHVRLDEPTRSLDQLAESCTALCRRIMNAPDDQARANLLARAPDEGSAPNLVN